MHSFHAAAPLLFAILTGCFGQGLAGEWEGDLDCGDGTVGLAADLEKTSRNIYAGSMTAESDTTIIDSGTSWRLILDIDWDLTVNTDGPGEQELHYEALLNDLNCLLYREGDLYSNDCEEMGISADNDRSDLGTFTWDGKDTIDIEDDDCHGSLER